MASVHEQKGSPCWYCAYRGAAGERVKKTTGIRVLPKPAPRGKARAEARRESRAEAMKVALALESAAAKARQGLLTEASARGALTAILSGVGAGEIDAWSTEDWVGEWLESRKVSSATRAKYETVVKRWCASLGARARLDLSHVTPGDVASYREKLSKAGLAAKTINVDLKTLRAIFRGAVNLGFITSNPAEAVELVPDLKGETTGKQPFTAEQVAALVAAADEEWRGVVLGGFYTGARLRDITGLTWGAVDFEARTIGFRQIKTGETVLVPMHGELEGYLLGLPSADKASAPIFPSLKDMGTGGGGGLSLRFKRLMARAGIEQGVARKRGAGKGTRTVSQLSFHSLRHALTSELAARDVAPEVRQKVTGHADAKTHAIYTHHELEQIRAAVDLLPSVEG